MNRIVEGPRYICGRWVVKARIEGKPVFVFGNSEVDVFLKIVSMEPEPA